MASERTVIVDTGPLVALLHAREPFHAWAVQQFKLLPAPFHTCEPVLTEAFHLLSRIHDGPKQFFELLSRRLLVVDFVLVDQVELLEKLVKKYCDLPMSLADACLVRMAEIHPTALVLTLDHHFKIYRKNGKQLVPCLLPESSS